MMGQFCAAHFALLAHAVMKIAPGCKKIVAIVLYTELQDVVDNYLNHSIPLDFMFSDIDYLDDYQDFTINPVNYSGLNDTVTKWKNAHNIHYVPILDAGIAYRPDEADYDAY